jgi:hypothetical protein
MGRCSLAYGTPLLIHGQQHDVPVPAFEDFVDPHASKSRKTAISIFIGLITLTNVLGKYLEQIYSVSKCNGETSNLSLTDLEDLLGSWEYSLPPEVRLIVTHGRMLTAPGSANFRLAYLAVKLLLRRIQLDLDRSKSETDDYASPYYTHAQRAAEDIVLFVQGLDHSHFPGFWIPVNEFSLTSAITFLLRSALRSKDSSHNGPLKIAKDMIETLRSLSTKFSWDLADNCLRICGDLVEKMEIVSNSVSSNATIDIQEFADLDDSVLDDLFAGYAGAFETEFWQYE